MALTWNTAKVVDFEKNFPDVKGRDSMGEDELQWNPAVIAFVNASIIIGVSRITKENVDDVFDRLWITEYVCGVFRHKSENGKPVEVPFTLDEVRKLVGIETNVTNKTFAQFSKSMMFSLANQANRERVSQEEGK